MIRYLAVSTLLHAAFLIAVSGVMLPPETSILDDDGSLTLTWKGHSPLQIEAQAGSETKNSSDVESVSSGEIINQADETLESVSEPFAAETQATQAPELRQMAVEKNGEASEVVLSGKNEKEKNREKPYKDDNKSHHIASGGQSGSQTKRALNVKAPAPPYPRMARKKGVEGVVLVKVLIGRDGSVLNVNLLKSSGRRDLDESALRTIRSRWRYKPASRYGKAVESAERVKIYFSLSRV